jgi:hypothetical protein
MDICEWSRWVGSHSIPVAVPSRSGGTKAESCFTCCGWGTGRRDRLPCASSRIDTDNILVGFGSRWVGSHSIPVAIPLQCVPVGLNRNHLSHVAEAHTEL